MNDLFSYLRIYIIHLRSKLKRKEKKNENSRQQQKEEIEDIFQHRSESLLTVPPQRINFAKDTSKTRRNSSSHHMNNTNCFETQIQS